MDEHSDSMTPHQRACLEQSLAECGDAFGNFDETLAEGLPDGSSPEWGYDLQLVFDIAEAVRRWKTRVGGWDV